MSFRLQLSTIAILKNRKKNSLVAFLLFYKANKAQYQNGKLRYFFENSYLGKKLIQGECFFYNLYHFFRPN